jgi:protein translocase SEC61 complex gamma subunit
LAFRSFIESVRRLIKVIDRPSREELWTSAKISALGVGILGIVGFIIKFIGAIFLQAPTTP